MDGNHQSIVCRYIVTSICLPALIAKLFKFPIKSSLLTNKFGVSYVVSRILCKMQGAHSVLVSALNIEPGEPQFNSPIYERRSIWHSK